MKTLRFINGLIFMGLFFAIFAMPSSAGACSCAADVTIPDNFALHEAVFTGIVVRIVDNYVPIFSTLDSVMYKLGYPPYFFHEDEKRVGYSIFFEVTKSWKGAEETLIEVNTGRGDGDCGYIFELNKEYLVYANYAYEIPGNYWVTSICGRTLGFSNAMEDFNYLNTFPTIPLQYRLSVMLTEKDLIIFGWPSLIIVGALIFIRQHHKNRSWKL